MLSPFCRVLIRCFILVAAFGSSVPLLAAADDYEDTPSIEGGSFVGEIQGCAMVPIPDIPLEDPKAAMVSIFKARALVPIPNPSEIEQYEHFKRDDADVWILHSNVVVEVDKACEMTALILKHSDRMYGQELSRQCDSYLDTVRESFTVLSRDLVPGGLTELVIAVSKGEDDITCRDECWDAFNAYAYALSLDGGSPHWIAFGAPLPALLPSPLKPLSLAECPTQDFEIEGDAKALATEAIKAFSEKRYTDAIAASQRASVLGKSGFNFTIARAAENLGDCTIARTFYRDFIFTSSYYGDDPRTSTAEQLLKDLGTCDPAITTAAKTKGLASPASPAPCDSEATPDFTTPENNTIKRAEAYCETKIALNGEDSEYRCGFSPMPWAEGEDSIGKPPLLPNVFFINESYNPSSWWTRTSLAVEANDQLWLLELTFSADSSIALDSQDESISSITTEDVIPGGQPEVVVRLDQSASIYSKDEEGYDRRSVPDTTENTLRVLVISLDGERPRVVFSAATAWSLKDYWLEEGVADAAPKAAEVTWKDGVVSVRKVAGSEPSAKVGDYKLSSGGCAAP